MKIWAKLTASLLLAATAQFAIADGVIKQDRPVMGQTSTDCSLSPYPGGGVRPVIEGASAQLQRNPNGITASVSMPTPLSGVYCYPPATLATNPAAGPAVPGHPEVYSFWAIYFNNPDACPESGCSAADVLGPNCPNAQAGAIQLSGHVVGGPVLHLSGHLSVGDGPLQPFGCAPLLDARKAEIHLAVAPHGLLIPELMPEMLQVPPGGGPGYWFPAVFEGVE